MCFIDFLNQLQPVRFLCYDSVTDPGGGVKIIIIIIIIIIKMAAKRSGLYVLFLAPPLSSFLVPLLYELRQHYALNYQSNCLLVYQ